MVIFGMVLCVADEHAAGEAPPLRSDLQLPSDPHPADCKRDGWRADGRLRRGEASPSRPRTSKAAVFSLQPRLRSLTY